MTGHPFVFTARNWATGIEHLREFIVVGNTFGLSPLLLAQCAYVAYLNLQCEIPAKQEILLRLRKRLSPDTAAGCGWSRGQALIDVRFASDEWRVNPAFAITRIVGSLSHELQHVHDFARGLRDAAPAAYGTRYERRAARTNILLFERTWAYDSLHKLMHRLILSAEREAKKAGWGK